MENNEEFFDAFETIEQLNHSILKEPDEDRVLFFTDRPKQRKLSQSSQDLAEYKTDLVLPSQKTELFSWTTLNLVKKNNKDIKEFSGLEIVQELQIRNQKNWVMKFSPDSKYFIMAGESPVIQVFKVSGKVTEKSLGLLGEVEDYNGHEQSVIDVEWDQSSEAFLSCGVDCLVLYWRVGHSIPTKQFVHDHIVTCIGFSPKNSCLFFTGSLSKKLTFWALPEGNVENMYQIKGLITSAKFSPEANILALGLSHGECILYEVHNAVITFLTQLDCKNRKGFKSNGKKVTNISFQDDQYILICTNDSRIRLFSLQTFSLLQKYKGGKCEQYPIGSAFSHNFIHVIRGSEDGSVYIWNTFKTESKSRWKLAFKGIKNSSYEYFNIKKQKSCSNAIFSTSEIVKNVQNELIFDGSEIIISHIILVSCSGKLYVLYNQFKNVPW